jgi:hypothetical protein
VVEVCKNGIRELFYNRWRDFIVDGDKKTDQLSGDVTQKEDQTW